MDRTACLLVAHCSYCDGNVDHQTPSLGDDKIRFALKDTFFAGDGEFWTLSMPGETMNDIEPTIHSLVHSLIRFHNAWGIF